MATPKSVGPNAALTPSGHTPPLSEAGSYFEEGSYYQESEYMLWKVHDRLAQKEGPRSTIFFINGQRYAGNWSDNKQSGQGTQTFKSGSKYEGEFVNGKPHGMGTFWKMEQGKLRLSYRGSYANGKREGPGTYSDPNGERYEGEWKEGKRHGKGKLFLPNGDVYDGEWRGGQRHGEGTLHLANGDVYQGEWLHDLKDGRGTFYYVSLHKRYDGVWEKGVAKCGLYGALDQGAGEECKVQLPSLTLDDPLGVLTDRAMEVHAAREERLGPDDLEEEVEESQVGSYRTNSQMGSEADEAASEVVNVEEF